MILIWKFVSSSTISWNNSCKNIAVFDNLKNGQDGGMNVKDVIPNLVIIIKPILFFSTY